MTTRLLAHVLDGYGTDPQITSLVDTRELWFIPVANPDGYDFTFEPGQRLWRKNLRDNNGDGVITPGDGVDLNRNYPYKWGYDNEGSSPNPASETYRGPAPGSEPETQALDAFVQRVDPEFFVNYHSAAELLLYGIGWQVATPSPDDVIYEAMAGDDADPAVPGLRPGHLRRAVHDQRRHRHAPAGPVRHARVHARDVDVRGRVRGRPGRRVRGRGLRQRLRVPRRRGAGAGRVREEHPVRAVGRGVGGRPRRPGDRHRRDRRGLRRRQLRRLLRRPADRRRHRQARAAGRAAALPRRRRPRRVGAGRASGPAASATATRTTTTTPSSAARSAAPRRQQRRGLVHRREARPRTGQSERFTYTVASDTGHDVLVVANEDYTGVNPTYPAGTDGPAVRRRPRGGASRPPATPRTSGTSTPRGCRTTSRARPLRRGALVPRRQPHHPGPGGRPHRRRRSGRCPTSPSPSGSST